MESSKKKFNSKKSWLKRITDYKCSNSSLTKDEPQDLILWNTSTDDLPTNRKTKNIFGPLRKVHNRVKLFVSKKKVRTFDSVPTCNAFESNSHLEILQKSHTTPSSSLEMAENIYSSKFLNRSSENVSPVTSSNNPHVTSPLFPGLRPPEHNSVCKEIIHLASHSWYWGPITKREAELKLNNLPDGSFLIRDSSSDVYLFSISFRSIGLTFHSHIEYNLGMYSLHNQQGFVSIVDLINFAMKKSADSVFCYTRARDMTPAFPIRLTNPVSRFTEVQSLLHLCRFVIKQSISINDIQKLPIPESLQQYLKQGHY